MLPISARLSLRLSTSRYTFNQMLAAFESLARYCPGYRSSTELEELFDLDYSRKRHLVYRIL